MFSHRRRRRATSQVQPGDGHALKPFRLWQVFTRSLFFLTDSHSDARSRSYAVSVPYVEWEDRADLYLDGQHQASSQLPAVFPVPRGVIEVQTSMFGLKRMHFVPDSGPHRQLEPHPRSAEGLRARLDSRHPTLSRWIGALSFLIMITALLLGMPQLAELVTSFDVVTAHTGTFTSPVALSPEANTALGIAAVAASTERALRLRHHWLLDGDLTDWDE